MSVLSVKPNEIYNYIKIIEFVGINKHGKKEFLCECLNCGSRIVLIGTFVKNGYSKSCGCLKRETSRKNMTKHGMCGTKLYNIWRSMKARCYSEHYHAKHRYKDRGIVVCDEWKDNFTKFYEDMKDGYFEGAQIDRINNDDIYKKENCRWVTPSENANNRSKYYNKTGYTGVTFKESINKYCAYMYYKRKSIHIGTFETLEDAVRTRREFIIKFNDENNTNIKYEDFKTE